MGADATAAVAAYAAPTFEEAELLAFVEGATDVCEHVDAEYVGGDLDTHQEFTVSTTALGRTDDPVGRTGATPGDRVCVTGTLGRSGAALRLFADGRYERANDLFRFEPRVAAGRALGSRATAMMDSSDGLARSLHQLAEASDCGFDVDEDAIPVDEAVHDVADDDATVRELGWYFGEDFELVCTVPADDVAAVRDACPVPLTVVGRVTETGVTVDGDRMPDRGFTHGE
jgi:thiamine-monophosphate kinase